MNNPSFPSPNQNSIGNESALVHKPLGPRSKIIFSLLMLVSALLATNFLYQEKVLNSVEPAAIAPVEIVAQPRAATDETEEPAQPTGIAAGISNDLIKDAQHPLDPLIAIAREALVKVDRDIHDYTATIIKKVRVNGRLGREQYLQIKIRHERTVDGKKIPFSVYSRFLKPRSMAGQEAIWIQGHNQEKIIAHPAGILNVMRLKLDPESPIAMQGNRYSIRNIGMKNLIKKMIERGETDRKLGNCQVRIERDIRVGNMRCSLLEIIHPIQTAPFEFYKARIYIDDDRDLPVAYEALLWPQSEDEKPRLLEKYVYTNIKTNVGLTDSDFDPNNQDYNYPGGD